jgi:hypothetical protein
MFSKYVFVTVYEDRKYTARSPDSYQKIIRPLRQMRQTLRSLGRGAQTRTRSGFGEPRACTPCSFFSLSPQYISEHLSRGDVIRILFLSSGRRILGVDI